MNAELLLLPSNIREIGIYLPIVGKYLSSNFITPYVPIEYACTIVSTQYIPTIYTHAMPNGYLPPATRHWNEYDRQAMLPIYAY